MSLLHKVGIVCCSNGQPSNTRTANLHLQSVLAQCGIETVFGSYLYTSDSVFSGTAKQRAQDLMNFYRDDSIDAIFDISGGDLASEILEEIDFDLIAQTQKQFWGYSDLTSIINSIYSQTGKSSMLYQIKNLVDADADVQQQHFFEYNAGHTDALFPDSLTFIQGTEMEGILLGGNIRCLLKLAGTRFFPDLQDKLLLLESYKGLVPQIVAFLSQLKQLGAFRQIKGIVLGTFTKMEQGHCSPTIEELVKHYAGPDIPIAVTRQIGHYPDSRAIEIGAFHRFVKSAD